LKSKEGLAHAHLGEKVLSVKRNLGRFLQLNLLSPPARLASGGSTTRSGTEINRGRRDDVTKHARFVVGTQFNIAQFSTHYPTILGDLAACDLSSSSRRCPVEDRRRAM
ncbi:MAG TPA: hypothetical protein VK554_02300, partial [Bradyrhizobium sp.]|nr:hypothetical protein [Bradyrhizobium sp.]